MFARLSNLVLILSLLTAVAALVPRKPAAPVNSVIQSRQATRTSIFRKQLIKQARDGMKVAVQARGEGGEQPQTSSNPYPKCPDYKGLGYAHYPGWDYYANDLPNNPLYVSPNTEENCIAACEAHVPVNNAGVPEKRTQVPDSHCIGVVYNQGYECYLKGERYQYGTFQIGTSDRSVDLKGDCAYWKSLVPAEMDAVCCNW